jgi:ATP-dependent Lon protease
MFDTIIPLFPLGVVLFPETSLPLHIFEERYKLMIGECLEQQKKFGIVLYSGDQIQNVGCTAKIVKVLKRYSDGRLDILTQGVERFVIHEIYDTKPYLESNVTFFDDDDERETDAIKQLASRGTELLKRFARRTGEGYFDSSLTTMQAKTISFLIAGSQGFTVEEKQRFLEMRTVSERLRKGVASLEKTIHRIELTEEIRKIINGNGSIPKSLLNNLKED